MNKEKTLGLGVIAVAVLIGGLIGAAVEARHVAAAKGDPLAEQLAVCVSNYAGATIALRGCATNFGELQAEAEEAVKELTDCRAGRKE